MINPEDIRYARNLIDSILVGLSRLEKGSTVEQNYLNEKITKLYNLHKGNNKHL